MKNRILTTSFREIKKSFPRFLSLIIMAFLGVLVFVGLQATAPDMRATLDTYLDRQNVYDLKIQLSTGIYKEDLDEIRKINNVEVVEGSYSSDFLLETNGNNDYVCRIHSYSEVTNIIELLDGRLPNEYIENTVNEIVVEEELLKKNNWNIGDSISFLDRDNKLNNSLFTIVGTIRSPLYYNNASINGNRGNSNLGNGTLNFYAYTSLSSFNNQSIYTEAYVLVKDTKQMMTNSKSYLKSISECEKEIQKLLPKFQENYEKRIDDKIKEIENQYNIKEDSVDQLIDYAKITYENIPTEENKQNLDNLIELKEIFSKLSEAKGKDVNLYSFDRTNYSTYTDFINDSQSLANLSKLFPTVFYAVAILVSLISMNRMVEDDRGTIGCLKSLGFSNEAILIKYLIFSLSASIIGSILGAALGLIIIPNLIWRMYQMLFTIPIFKLGVNISAVLLGTLIAIVCICGTTIFTAYKILKGKPASLLRPKSPKIGKKVFLERFKKLWSHISFSNKIIIRNISRYKKRVFVTVGGILGCTALMLCGFGIKDSLTKICPAQFNNVYYYDAMAYVNQSIDDDRMNSIFNDSNILSYYETKQFSAKNGNVNLTIIVPKDENSISEVISINNIKNKKEIMSLEDNKVIISDKLSEVLSLGVGDVLGFINEDNITFNYTISGVCENYIGHNVFMNKNTYESNGLDYVTNVVLLKTKDMDKDTQESFKKELLSNEEISNVTMVETLVSGVDNMLQTLNQVVLILIFLAAALAFVVLYNLSNINIHERKREIATLKVLGFYNKEVDDYITKENIILTIIGIVLGLVFGYFFTNIVLVTVEIEHVRFVHYISWKSYLISSLLSITFTIIVNIISHFSLKKINMIDSLKSVE